MPMRIGWLGLPRLRPVFGWIDLAIFMLAAAGCVLGRRSRYRRTVLLFGLPLLVRFAIYAFAIPQATTERYLVELFPLLLMLALIGFASIRHANKIRIPVATAV
jgi:CHASE2 domain-containing sensor protein